MKEIRSDISNKVKGLVWLIEMVNEAHKCDYRQFFVEEKKHTCKGLIYSEWVFRGLKEINIHKFKSYLTINKAMAMCKYLNEKFNNTQIHFNVVPIYVNANYFPKPLDEVIKNDYVFKGYTKECFNIFNDRFVVAISTEKILIIDLNSGYYSSIAFCYSGNTIYETYSKFKEELSDCSFLINVSKVAFELTIMSYMTYNQYYLSDIMLSKMFRLGQYTPTI